MGGRERSGPFQSPARRLVLDSPSRTFAGLSSVERPRDERVSTPSPRELQRKGLASDAARNLQNPVRGRIGIFLPNGAVTESNEYRIGRLEQKVTDLDFDVKTVRAEFLAFRKFLEEREETRRKERVQNLWMALGAMLATGSLVVGALSLLNGLL